MTATESLILHKTLHLNFQSYSLLVTEIILLLICVLQAIALLSCRFGHFNQWYLIYQAFVNGFLAVEKDGDVCRR